MAHYQRRIESSFSTCRLQSVQDLNPLLVTTPFSSYPCWITTMTPARMSCLCTWPGSALRPKPMWYWWMAILSSCRAGGKGNFSASCSVHGSVLIVHKSCSALRVVPVMTQNHGSLPDASRPPVWIISVASNLVCRHWTDRSSQESSWTVLIFYRTTVTAALMDALATSTYPSESTIVLKCVPPIPNPVNKEYGRWRTVALSFSAWKHSMRCEPFTSSWQRHRIISCHPSRMS